MYLLANRAQVVDEKKAAEVANYLAEAGGQHKSAFSFGEYLEQQNLSYTDIVAGGPTRNRARLIYLQCGHKCSKLANQPHFSNFITAIIILASALVGIQTYPVMEYVPGREHNSRISRVWAVMDQIVLYIFTFEVVVKILAEGFSPWRYFGRYENTDEQEDPITPSGSYADLNDANQQPSKEGQKMDELWIMASKESIMMTAKQREAFRQSGTRDPARFLRKMSKDPMKAKEKAGFNIMNVKLDFWNVFDFVVVLVCYLPLGAGMVAVIRLFRLLRVLKLVKALPELQVLVVGLLSSMTAIFYVGLLLLLVFYLYAVLCVTMLRENDPVHWENLQIAYLTLFRMATLEDWIDVVYTAMLGCDIYGYGFREDECVTPKPLGWLAAPMFVSFVVVATFVVLNLFIGVINENMGLAKEQLEDMKKKEELKKAEKMNAEDEDSRELTELHHLASRVKLLTKRSARLHQAMGMVQYDMNTLVEKMQLRSDRYEVNDSGVMEERPPKLFRKRSKSKSANQIHDHDVDESNPSDGKNAGDLPSEDIYARNDAVLPFEPELSTVIE